jgi:Cu-Zn family superoxide dismutase
MKAVATFQGRLNGSRVHFSQQKDSNIVTVRGEMRGLTGIHGMHVHEYGDLMHHGKHFNPNDGYHGDRNDPHSHAGDLGNISGVNFTIKTRKISLRVTDENCVIGRCLVIHQGEDDLVSQPSGDSGDMMDLAVIGLAPKNKK